MYITQIRVGTYHCNQTVRGTSVMNTINFDTWQFGGASSSGIVKLV